MTDELRSHAIAFVDRRLHRKQAEHEVGAAADLLCALLAPGPDRRTDVVHAVRMPRALSLRSSVRLKSGASMPMNAVAGSAAMRCSRSARMRRSSGRCLSTSTSPITARLFRGIPGVEPRGDHARSADADETRLRIAFAQCLDEAGAELIAQRLRLQRARTPARCRFRRLPAVRRRHGLISAPARRWLRSMKSSMRLHVGRVGRHACEFLARFGERQAGFVQRLVRAANREDADRCRNRGASKGRFAVDAFRLGEAAGDRHVRRLLVAVDDRAHRRERVCADLAELVHQREAAEDDPVIDGDVTGERCGVREDRVVADDAVVREVARKPSASCRCRCA